MRVITRGIASRQSVVVSSRVSCVKLEFEFDAIMQNIVPMSRPSLELRASQQLALTPALQQSIKLLQLSALDLELEIARALEENPLLENERVEDPVHDSPQDQAPSDGSDEDVAAAPDMTAEALDFSAGSRSDDDERDERPESAQPVSLRAHLLQQLRTTHAGERDQVLVATLIDELDEAGYLASPIEEIQTWVDASLDISIDEWRAALRLLQSLDPPGVGARSLSECLDLQLQYLDKERFPGLSTAESIALARVICQRHLAVLGQGNLAKLREALGCTQDELKQAHGLILRLNPRPGSAWNVPAADAAIPDVVARKSGKKWVARLNDAVVPKLRIHALYAEALGSARSGADRVLHDQLQEARLLIRNVAQRFETILKVSQAIVSHQQAFFSQGWGALRPMTLRDIASDLGLHESTISRATSQKYMLTPFGTVELKRFFSVGLTASVSGEATSATAIQNRIQALVKNEDRAAPLSDSQLVSLLEKEGIEIARRTVAKYRELLRIPTAPLRKSQSGQA